MKLWLLRPVEDLPAGDDPWEPWYNKCIGHVVRAATEAEARRLANEKGGAEVRTKNPWLDPKYSTCVELTADGEAAVIISDVQYA